LTLKDYSKRHLTKIQSGLAPKNPREGYRNILGGQIAREIGSSVEDATARLEEVRKTLSSLYSEFCLIYFNQNKGIDPRGKERADFPVSRKTSVSIIDKMYRYNCVNNDQFPNPPAGGWLTTDKLTKSLDDLLRTQATFLFSDAVDEFAFKIEERFEDLHSHTKPHQDLNRGLHAQHLYLKIPSRPRKVKFEIQIYTASQLGWRPLQHQLYEKYRIGEIEPVEKVMDAWSASIGSTIFLVDIHIKRLKDSLLS
jgi:ppGpp synthetase/RelA/SpoT-type nucleotidyltranferase